MQTFGKAIGHLLVMDDMSIAIYYYLVGLEDEAITHLMDSDVVVQAYHVISKLTVYYCCIWLLILIIKMHIYNPIVETK